jgi:hypothetical protein
MDLKQVHCYDGNWSEMAQETEYFISEMRHFISSWKLLCCMLAIGPKVRGCRLRWGDGYLRAIKIRSTPSFEEEVNPEAPCRKILRRVKVSYKNEQKYYASQDLSFHSPVPPACYQITVLVGMPGSSGGLIRSFTLSTSFHHASPCSHITWKWTILRWWQ